VERLDILFAVLGDGVLFRQPRAAVLDRREDRGRDLVIVHLHGRAGEEPAREQLARLCCARSATSFVAEEHGSSSGGSSARIARRIPRRARACCGGGANLDRDRRELELAVDDVADGVDVRDVGLAARQVLGWPKRRKLARAFLWEYSFERLKLVQLLGQLGIFLTCSQVVIILPLRCTSTPTLSSPIVPVHAYENNHDTLSDKPFYQLDSKHPSQLLKVSW
jgi:hypothetical protein